MRRMKDRCPFKDPGRCDIWMDYQISLNSLKETEELAHGNWIEICRLHERIELLESILRKNRIDIPPEY